MNAHSFAVRFLAICLLWGLAGAPALACNEAPVASISSPYQRFADLGVEVTLDGSSSYDPDEDEIIAYEWCAYKYIGYGYTFVTGSGREGVTTTMSFTSMGIYRIELSVEDEHNTWSDWPDTCYVYLVDTSLSRSEGCVGMGGLVEIWPSVNPADIGGGSAKLSKTCSGNGNVNVWEPVGLDKTGTLRSLPHSWPLWRVMMPSPLYVEGTAASSATDDVELSFCFVSGGLQSTPRVVRFTIKPDAGNTPAQATEIDITQPVFEALGPGDSADWYKFAVNSGGLFNIELAFDDAAANLDWYVYSTSNTVNPIASKTTSSNPETGVAGLSPGQYYLKIVPVGTLTAACPFKVTTTKTLTVNADIDVDSDRSGSVEGTMTEENLEEQQAAIVPVNCDDDDVPPDHQRDCYDDRINGGNDTSDLVDIVIGKVTLPSSQWSAWLEIVDADGNLINASSSPPIGAFIKVLNGKSPSTSVVVLGWVTNQSWAWVNQVDISSQIGNGPLFYSVESVGFPLTLGETCFLSLRIQGPPGTPTIQDRVRLQPSVFVLVPGSDSPEEVYSTDRSDSDQDDEIAAVGTAIVSMNLNATYAGDPWLQDAAEIGYTKWPGGQMHVAMDLPREGRALQSWPESSLLGPGMGVFPIGSGNSSQDYGGNIEAIGDAHVVIGTGCSTDITSFIAAQGVQSVIIAPQTAYLLVGHIDELVSFSGSSAYIADVNLATTLVENFVNNNTHANGSITGAAANYAEISTASWTTDQWAGGYVEIMDLWYWQTQTREIVHNDATRVYVYDSSTTKGRPWSPTPDPVNYPGRWQYTLIARSEFRTVFCEGPEDFGVVTERVNNSTLRDGSGLHDWSQADWSGGYVMLYDATQGGFDENPERKRIISNTANTITIAGTWNGDPYECRYVLVKKSKRDSAYWHVYYGTPEGDPVCMAIRDLWSAYGTIQPAWSSRITQLRNLLLQQTPVSSFASVPALFDADSSASALLPGMVNLLNTGGSNLHVPNPYGPRNANGEDVFKINSPFSLGSLVDSWPLHGGVGGGGGEIHCGTNTVHSIPSTNWWN